MSDKSTVERKLAKLAAAGTAGADGRTRVLKSPQDALSLLVAEIDDIVLPATLECTDENGRALRCDVSGRRLLRLAATRAPAGHGAILDTELDGDDPELPGAIRALIEGLFSGSDTLNMTTHPLGRSVGPAEVGISPRTLAAAWELPELSLADPEAAMRVFLERHADRIAAWHIAGGESRGDAALWGETPPDRVIETLLDPKIIADAGPVLVSIALDGDEALIAARIGDVSLAILSPWAELPTLTDDWQRVTGL